MRTLPKASALAALAGLLVTSSLAGCGKDAEPPEYLALGDSAPFGFQQNAPGGYADDDDFVGYPALLAEDRGLPVRDLSCPGETTASFLDEDAVSAACTNTAGEGPGYRDRYPLHADYDGAQFDAAVETLRDEPGIELVTLQLGANDLLLCVVTTECETAAGVAAMADRVRENVGTALAALRDEGGYAGTVVVVNYSALEYGGDDPLTAATAQLNAAIAEAAAAHDAVVADAFEAFRVESEGNGGDVIEAGLVYPGDTHPTAVGQRLIARTIEADLERGK